MVAELERSPEFVAELICKAFDLLKAQKAVVVRVHPGTFHRLSEDELLRNVLREAGISSELVELEIDEALEPDQFSATVNNVSVRYDLSQALAEMIVNLEQRALASAEDKPEVGDGQE
jgi:hypothetical protein